MNLFNKQSVKLNSGIISDFKIDCDALTDEDIKCIAYMISKMCKFSGVTGVPTGGLRLAAHLVPYIAPDYKLPILICDDVLTTGASMEKLKSQNTIGVVIFARGKCPAWVTPLFKLNSLV